MSLKWVCLALIRVFLLSRNRLKYFFIGQDFFRQFDQTLQIHEGLIFVKSFEPAHAQTSPDFQFEYLPYYYYY